MNLFFQLIPYEKLTTTHSFQASPDQQRASLDGNSTQNKILVENLKKGKSKKQLRSYWNPIQQKLYTQFLIKNADLFYKSVADRRNLQINVLMSKAIKTRNKRQCHSHHQKMMQRHKSIKRIILSNQHYLTSTSDGNNQQSAKDTQNNQNDPEMLSDFWLMQFSERDYQQECKDFNFYEPAEYIQRDVQQKILFFETDQVIDL